MPDVIILEGPPALNSTPDLPTYASVADVLEKKNGSGLRLAGWTVLRTLMIAPPMMLVGVPAKQAFAGAAISSALISLFTLIRIADAAKNQGGRGTSQPWIMGPFEGRIPKPSGRGTYR